MGPEKGKRETRASQKRGNDGNRVGEILRYNTAGFEDGGGETSKRM